MLVWGREDISSIENKTGTVEKQIARSNPPYKIISEDYQRTISIDHVNSL